MYADRITIYGNTVISTLFCCIGVNGQSGSGSGSGLVYIVTITATPSTTSYSVGDIVTLMCIVDPPTYSNVNVTYSWQCDGCFADGMTDMAIMRVLTEMDNSTINCSAIINNEIFTTDVPFDLQVTQGRVVSFWPNKNIILCNMYMHSIICTWLINVNITFEV